MAKMIAIFLIALILIPAMAPMRAMARAVGFQVIQVSVPQDVPLDVAVWYPTTAKPSAHRLAPFVQSVALNGAVAGRGRGLVVMSHGTGEWYGAQYDTALALAKAGFIVAAPTHTGDNFHDHSRAIRLPDRPLQIHAVISAMLDSWPERRLIDPDRVGVFGFSAGALTALIVAGATPDLGKIAAHCRDHPQFFDCNLVRQHADETPALSPPIWTHDARIRAVVVAAPALGFVFPPDGLKGVTMPVQLWQAGDDHVLPRPYYVEAVRDALPTPPDFHVAAGADHLDFLAPCSSRLRTSTPELCHEQGGFDRAKFHREFNRSVVAFFTKTL